MTVEEILRQAGIGDEQVKALDPKMITAFSGVLSEAQQAREAAELAQRSYTDFYENKIAPSLVQWDEERARLDNAMATAQAEAAYYRTQNEAARNAGFIASDAPGYQARDPQGRYVAGVPGSTPGSPTFDVNQVYQRAGDAINVLTDIQWEHQKLFGQPLPISPSELVKRADAQRMDPRSYASREYGWDARRQQMKDEEGKKHDDEIRRQALAENDRKWAERVGSNPDVRMAQDSRYADHQRAVKAGTMPDPIMLTESERRSATRSAIRADMQERND